MKRAVLFLLTVCFLSVSCGSESSDNSTSSPYYDQVLDWQTRMFTECDVADFETNNYTVSSMYLMHSLNILLVDTPKPPAVTSEPGVWKTSCATAVEGGNCIDLSAYYYSSVKDARIVPSSKLRIRVYTLDGVLDDHAVLVVIGEDGDEYVIDGTLNMSYVLTIDRWMEIYPLWRPEVKAITYLCEFNLFDYWQ